jgi:DJ-1 family protein
VVKADMEIGSYKDLPDALVLPGGARGVNNLSRSKIVKDLINRAYKNGKIIAAICAAPSAILAPMNILKGKEATCYPSDASILKDKAKYVDKSVVVDGNIITSKGPGTAFDFALKLVEILAGKSVKENVRKKTLYGLD